MLTLASVTTSLAAICKLPEYSVKCKFFFFLVKISVKWSNIIRPHTVAVRHFDISFQVVGYTQSTNLSCIRITYITSVLFFCIQFKLLNARSVVSLWLETNWLVCKTLCLCRRELRLRTITSTWRLQGKMGRWSSSKSKDTHPSANSWRHIVNDRWVERPFSSSPTTYKYFAFTVISHSVSPLVAHFTLLFLHQKSFYIWVHLDVCCVTCLQGLAIRQIRFRFDGQPINETDTPAQVRYYGIYAIMFS